MTDWVEPWSWTKNEVITASKLNTLRQAILYLKETTDDYHRSARPIDHPDGSIPPSKLDAINTPSDGQAPVYDGETGRFRWATGMGGVSRLSELTIDVSKDWAGYRIRNLGEPVDPGDALRLPWNHASRHLPGGGDPLSGLSRSQVSDFFSSPFWGQIPDKPSTFPPSPHASAHAPGGSDPLSGLSRSQLSDFFAPPFWNSIPDKPSAFPPSTHASTHVPGGADALSGLSRSQISDIWSSPFWDNIPDKPSSYPPSAHASTHASGGSDALSGLSRSMLTDLWSSPFWTQIPDKPSTFPPSAHSSSHAPGGSDALSGLSRSQVSDFFASPFWNQIPDKPSTFPPSAHASTHAPGGSDALSGLSRSQVSDFFSSPFWGNIPDKPSTFPPSSHASTHQTGGSDPITSLDAGVITSGTLNLNRVPSIPPSKLDAVDTPSNGEVPSYNASQGKFEWITPAGGAADYPRKLKPSLLRYVIPGWYVYTVSSYQVTAGRIYYIPIFVTEVTTYDLISIYVVTGASGTADLRVFAWSNGVPGSQILSAGTVDTSSTGPKGISINLTLNRGYYFLAFRCTANPTLYGPNEAYAVKPPVPGFYNYPYPNPICVVLYADAQYSDPAPDPTGAVSAAQAMVYLREVS